MKSSKLVAMTGAIVLPSPRSIWARCGSTQVSQKAMKLSAIL
jgi:hypothetical protein